MSIVKSPKYKCMYCEKEFVYFKKLTEHKLICQYIYNEKSNHAEFDISPIISIQQVYTLLPLLINKINNLENEVSELKVKLKRRDKRVEFDILNWLKTSITPTVYFEDYIKHINIMETHFEYFKENDFIEVLGKVIENFIERQENKTIPIFYGEGKIRKLYVYLQNDGWCELNDECIKIIIRIIHKNLLNHICEWRDDNAVLISNCDINNRMYNKLIIKLMGVDCNSPILIKKSRDTIYEKIKLFINMDNFC
jgi:hypothetical protein